MQNTGDQDGFDAGNTAASLTKIQVRKSKATTRPKVMASAPKAGDITDRLALLSAELDRDGPDIAPTEVSVEIPVEISVPPPAGTSTSATEPITAPPAIRRPAPPKNTGWGQPKQVPPDILTYWMGIRKGRRYPSWESLEPDIIGKYWPNCILVHCNTDIGRLQVKYEFTNAVRKATQDDALQEKEFIKRIEFTPMIVDWILSLGREVANSGKPSHDTEYFPTLTGECPLRLIALPLSDNARKVDHVLCYIQQLK